MAVVFGPVSCSSCLVPKSKFLHNPETQSGFILTLGALRRLPRQERSHHGGKNIGFPSLKNVAVQ